MPKFLDTTDEPTYGIAICARCKIKFPLSALSADPNSPGIYVCADDLDQLDPYRLPPKTPDDTTLPFYQPDRRMPFDKDG